MNDDARFRVAQNAASGADCGAAGGDAVKAALGIKSELQLAAFHALFAHDLAQQRRLNIFFVHACHCAHTAAGAFAHFAVNTQIKPSSFPPRRNDCVRCQQHLQVQRNNKRFRADPFPAAENRRSAVRFVV